MESLNSNSQERDASVETNARQSKRKLHGIFSTTSFTPQDFQTFKATMLLNLDQLEKDLAKEEFQELESFNAFRVLLLQFQTFLYSRFSLDNDECLMISKKEQSINESMTEQCSQKRERLLPVKYWMLG
ncbi:hypothetical protein Tco_0069766 [Tanacetum coccineum]